MLGYGAGCVFGQRFALGNAIYRDADNAVGNAHHTCDRMLCLRCSPFSSFSTVNDDNPLKVTGMVLDLFRSIDRDHDGELTEARAFFVCGRHHFTITRGVVR
jgi:hypothetical protein